MTEERAKYKVPKRVKGQHGGPRVAGPGKKMGAPLKLNTVLTRFDVRIPREWATKIAEYGGGKLSTGIRRIIEESGVVG